MNKNYELKTLRRNLKKVNEALDLMHEMAKRSIKPIPKEAESAIANREAEREELKDAIEKMKQLRSN